MHVDWTISFGDILKLAGVLYVTFILYGRLSARLARIELQVQLMFESWTGKVRDCARADCPRHLEER